MYYDLQSILQALEFKLKNGWKPERTLYVAFGHDEEVTVTLMVHCLGLVMFVKNSGTVNFLKCINLAVKKVDVSAH